MGHSWVLLTYLWSSVLFVTVVPAFTTPVKHVALTYPRRDTDDGDDGDASFIDVDDYTFCDYTKDYKDLNELNLDILTNAATSGLQSLVGLSLASNATLRSDCVAVYALGALINMLDTAYANYTSVNDGYDDDFNSYVTYMKKLVPSVLDNEFMFNTASTTPQMNIPSNGPGLSFFNCQTEGNSATFPCTDVALSSHYEAMATHKTTLTLSNRDNYTAELINSGISADWATFGDHEIDKTLAQANGGRTFKYKFSGWPIENSSMIVPNPKDIVTKGLPSMPDLRNDMEATMQDMMLGIWTNGSLADPVQAYSAPVFMLMQAVDAMAQAKALGKVEEKAEEDEAKRKKNFILLIVSVVLMFVPVVGEEVALAVGMTSLARAIAIAGELGNAAVSVYDTVTDPKSAVVNILGMLLGVGAIAKVTRDGPGISDIAKIRRGMSQDEVKGLGAIFKKQDDNLQSVMKFCKW